MIRPIPNPPMDQEDLARFHHTLEKHLRGSYTSAERKIMEDRNDRADAALNQLIENCGGKNPFLEN